MLKKLTGIILLAILFTGTLAAFDGYVEITNATGFLVNEIYVSHESEEVWGDNMLRGAELPDGESYRVNLIGQPSSIFDIMIVDIDGDTYTFQAVDVEQYDLTVTLENLDMADDASMALETTISGPGGGFDGWVDIVNDTGFTMFYLYIRQDSKGWGPDLLGDDVLLDSSTFTINVLNFAHSRFDIRLEDEDGDTYTIENMDIETDNLYLTLEYLDE